MLASAITPAVLISAVLAAAPGIRPGQQLTYHGTVALRDSDGAANAPQPKSFDLRWIVVKADETGAKLLWLVDEQGPGAWPWPDRFGQLSLDAKGVAVAGDVGPALLYDYGDGESVVPLPPPLAPSEKPLAAGVKWSLAGEDYSVQGERKADGREGWQVRVENRYGVQRNLQIDKTAPLLLAQNQRVFMNMGSEYELAMKLTSVADLSAEALATTEGTIARLLELRGKLQRPTRTPDGAWNPAQLKQLAEALPEIERRAAGSPLAALLAAATRDSKAQGGRADEIAALVARQLGKPLAPFSLPGLAGGSLTEKDLVGQVTVLHFWDYKDQPLKEPYGQVGYLEFLFQKRKDQGVKVYGVAVDPRLADEAGRRAATTGVRKLKAFMNLTYPIALDGGELIKAIGDPRTAGAALPLFVVIGRDGKVTHYHVGFYDVDRQIGLKELSAAVDEALKTQPPAK
ncbi:MAG TPA: TlpA disulfide reductase family protein [Pirellulales bacterium]|jgi:alkyl hydroperoxide reductase subunit AhpC